MLGKLFRWKFGARKVSRCGAHTEWERRLIELSSRLTKNDYSRAVKIADYFSGLMERKQIKYVRHVTGTGREGAKIEFTGTFYSSKNLQYNKEEIMEAYRTVYVQTKDEETASIVKDIVMPRVARLLPSEFSEPLSMEDFDALEVIRARQDKQLQEELGLLQAIRRINVYFENKNVS